MTENTTDTTTRYRIWISDGTETGNLGQMAAIVTISERDGDDWILTDHNAYDGDTIQIASGDDGRLPWDSDIQAAPLVAAAREWVEARTGQTGWVTDGDELILDVA